MNIDAGWAAVAVSSIAAIISVCAAFYAGIQASAAKRQADAAHGDIEPTFHCEIHEDDGRAPWGFRLIICNFNRHSLRLRAIDVAVPASLIVWRNDEYEPDRIRNTIEAVVRRGAASFEVNKVLSGVSPNAAQPTTFEVDFTLGLEPRRPRIDTSSM